MPAYIKRWYLCPSKITKQNQNIGDFRPLIKRLQIKPQSNISTKYQARTPTKTQIPMPCDFYSCAYIFCHILYGFNPSARIKLLWPTSKILTCFNSSTIKDLLDAQIKVLHSGLGEEINTNTLLQDKGIYYKTRVPKFRIKRKNDAGSENRDTCWCYLNFKLGPSVPWTFRCKAVKSIVPKNSSLLKNFTMCFHLI